MRQSVLDRDGRGTFLQTPISYQGDFTVKLLQIFLAEQSSIFISILARRADTKGARLWVRQEPRSEYTIVCLTALAGGRIFALVEDGRTFFQRTA